MMPNDTFERIVADWFHADAEHRVPDHLDAVLRRVSTERQRSAWSSLERWLPMDTTFSRRIAPAFQPVGPLVVAALVLVALVAAILLAGSPQRPLPPPFGPALTGLTVRAEGGDIYLVDPVTKRRTIVTSGPEWDSYPVFSPDGTRLAFLRRTTQADSYDSLFVANADGGAQRSVTERALRISSGGWSGDGAYIAFTSVVEGIAAITVVDLRGGSSNVLGGAGMFAESVSWLPPNGQEIVFRGTSSQWSAVWAMRPDGTELRPLTPRDGARDSGYEEPVVSPDGRLLAYWSWDNNIAQVVHVRDLVDGLTWAIPNSAPYDDRTRPSFSPDGRRLLMYRSLRDGPSPHFNGVAQLVLAAPDGGQSSIPLGPEFPYVDSAVPDLVATFSTDGSHVILLNRGEHKLWTLPVDGGAGTVEPWGSDDLPGLQRIAP
jgi:dipeptidyl aminopeptidase/acylaminoacyl peptidase